MVVLPSALGLEASELQAINIGCQTIRCPIVVQFAEVFVKRAVLLQMMCLMDCREALKVAVTDAAELIFRVQLPVPEQPLDFSTGQERADLVAFLESLTGETPANLGEP